MERTTDLADGLRGEEEGVALVGSAIGSDHRVRYLVKFVGVVEDSDTQVNSGLVA